MKMNVKWLCNGIPAEHNVGHDKAFKHEEQRLQFFLLGPFRSLSNLKQSTYTDLSTRKFDFTGSCAGLTAVCLDQCEVVYGHKFLEFTCCCACKMFVRYDCRRCCGLQLQKVSKHLLDTSTAPIDVV